MERNKENQDWLRIASSIRDDLYRYVQEHALRSLVLGGSGGIDSALTAVLASEVCKKSGIPLIGRSIPIETNTTEERVRARKVGEAFCADFREVDLTRLYTEVRETVEEVNCTVPTREDKVRRGNIKARLRMIYLYHLAQQYRGMVLSTDNRTEYMLGFWTLHGDVGDYTPLFGLWKTEVYALGETLLEQEKDVRRSEALESCIRALPTDGLGITRSDVEQLGAVDYSEVDMTLMRCCRGELGSGNEMVVRRYLDSEYKRNNPRVIVRDRLGLNS